MIMGKAIKVATVNVQCECGFNGKAGFSSNVSDLRFGAGAKVSFITLHPKPNTIAELQVGGVKRKVVQALQSDYIPNMWNFFIN